MHLTYTASECVLDHIAACGSQSMASLRRECTVQCTEPAFLDRTTPEQRFNALHAALEALAHAGLLEVNLEDGSYDISEFGWGMLQQGIYRNRR